MTAFEPVELGECHDSFNGQPGVRYTPGVCLEINPQYNDGALPVTTSARSLWGDKAVSKKEEIRQKTLEYISMGKPALESTIEKSVIEERSAALEVLTAIQKWQKYADETSLMLRASAYLRVCGFKPVPQKNVWEQLKGNPSCTAAYEYFFGYPDEKLPCYERQNSVYKGNIYMTYDTKRGGPWATQGEKGVAVHYNVWIVIPVLSHDDGDEAPSEFQYREEYSEITSGEKKFWGENARAEAEKYLEGRRKFMDKKFFWCDNPYIPKEHLKNFSVGGFLIPYYRRDPAET